MPRQAIKQATCENCDDENAEFRVTDTHTNIDETEVVYDVCCSCYAEGTITLDEEGTTAGDGINLDDASWNEGSDDE